MLRPPCIKHYVLPTIKRRTRTVMSVVRVVQVRLFMEPHAYAKSHKTFATFISVFYTKSMHVTTGNIKRTIIRQFKRKTRHYSKSNIMAPILTHSFSSIINKSCLEITEWSSIYTCRNVGARIEHNGN